MWSGVTIHGHSNFMPIGTISLHHQFGPRVTPLGRHGRNGSRHRLSTSWPPPEVHEAARTAAARHSSFFLSSLVFSSLLGPTVAAWVG
ncbi:hypothetical protein SETIT_9G314700v2 [Setaria italica]|uniref:Uncharacterized protein n=1 Tax=Setaria italica TaxID=4555 RepID=A0A368SMQ0_SETIT|nr:hypothetical protein SETIT_9G314700v2 [Setaria italica]